MQRATTSPSTLGPRPSVVVLLSLFLLVFLPPLSCSTLPERSAMPDARADAERLVISNLWPILFALLSCGGCTDIDCWQVSEIYQQGRMQAGRRGCRG